MRCNFQKFYLSIYYAFLIAGMLPSTLPPLPAILCLLPEYVDHRVSMTCAMILLCPSGIKINCIWSEHLNNRFDGKNNWIILWIRLLLYNRRYRNE